jgi:hypothetical protein
MLWPYPVLNGAGLTAEQRAISAGSHPPPLPEINVPCKSRPGHPSKGNAGKIDEQLRGSKPMAGEINILEKHKMQQSRLGDE